MTEAQRDWKEMHPMIKKAKPLFNLSKAPTNKYRLKIYKVIKYWAFDPFIILLIILNIVTMGMTYYQQSLAYTNSLIQINLFFTGVFIVEASLKISAFGPNIYIRNSWNQFDFFVVVCSILDIVMDQMNLSAIPILTVGPQIARVLRILRVSRLLRLTKGAKGL